MVIGRARDAAVAWRYVGAIILAVTMLACTALVPQVALSSPTICRG